MWQRVQDCTVSLLSVKVLGRQPSGRKLVRCEAPETIGVTCSDPSPTVSLIARCLVVTHASCAAARTASHIMPLRVGRRTQMLEANLCGQLPKL